jgi:hypothetical protein
MHDANAAANRATRRPLTKDTEQKTIIINRSGRSIYPEEKSVQTSGATSVLFKITAIDKPTEGASQDYLFCFHLPLLPA